MSYPLFLTNKIANISAKIKDMFTHETLSKTTKPVYVMPERLRQFNMITIQDAT